MRNNCICSIVGLLSTNEYLIDFDGFRVERNINTCRLKTFRSACITVLVQYWRLKHVPVCMYHCISPILREKQSSWRLKHVPVYKHYNDNQSEWIKQQTRFSFKIVASLFKTNCINTGMQVFQIEYRLWSLKSWNIHVLVRKVSYLA